MDECEHSIEISLATTEEFENDDDVIDMLDSENRNSPPAPFPDIQQPLSSSDDDDDIADDRSNSDIDNAVEQNLELTDGEVHLIVHVTYSKSITVPAVKMESFLKQSKISENSTPLTICIRNTSGEEVTTYLCLDKEGYFSARLKNGATVINCLGLDAGTYYRLDYLGYTVGKETVYNFKNGGEISVSKTNHRKKNTGKNKDARNINIPKQIYVGDVSDWADEAANQPLVSVQVPDDVPAFWDITADTKKLYVLADSYRIFMDQIKYPYKRDIDLLIEVETEGCRKFYTSFHGGEGICNGNLRNASGLCKMAGICSETVLRMHYLGYRVLKNGTKVYCFRAEKQESLDASPAPSSTVSDSEAMRKTRQQTQQQTQQQQTTTDLPPSIPFSVPDWVKEAVKQPLVSVQLPDRVPESWAIKVNRIGPIDVPARAFKIFMQQIGAENSRHQETYIELLHEDYQNLYTSIMERAARESGYIRRATEFRSRLGLTDAEIVLKARYLGYRALQDGRKVHCLRTEKIKITRENKKEMDDLVSFKRSNDARKNNARQLPRAFLPPERDRETSGDEPSRSKLVAKKVAGPLSGPLSFLNNGQKKVAPVPTPSLFPLSLIPDWVKRAQQAQTVQLHQHQQDGAGPSGLQQQQQRQQLQPNLTTDLADLVADSLLARSDLDENLVCKYLSMFARLPKETREIDGKFILKLASGAAVSRLQLFLENAVQQQPYIKTE